MKTQVKIGNLETSLRWAEIEDASAIARLELSSSRYENRAEPIDFTHAQFTNFWVKRIKVDKLKTVVACGPTQIYGFLTFKGAIEEGDILALYIDPLYMRNGIGKLLLQTAEKMVQLKGGKKISVDVEVLNYGAIKFYETLQFAKVSVKLDHLIVMEKEL